MRLRIVGILVCASVLSACGGGVGGTVGRTSVNANDARFASAGTSNLGKRVFVGYNSATILAYDEGSLARVGQIKTAGPNVVALALSPDGKTLFAALGTSGARASDNTTSLSAIDVASMKPKKTVQLSGQILVLGESNNAAVLVATVQQKSASYAVVYDPGTLEVIKKITLPNLQADSSLAIANDGTAAFVTNGVFRVDITHGTASSFLPSNVFVDAQGIALDALDQHLYIGSNDGSVSIFDTATGNQTGRIPYTGVQIFGVSESSDKSTIVVGGICGCADDWNVEAASISSMSASVIKQFALRQGANGSPTVNKNGTEVFFFGSYFTAYNPMNGGFLGVAAALAPSTTVTSIAAQ